MTEIYEHKDGSSWERYTLVNTGGSPLIRKETEWRGPSDPHDWETEVSTISVESFLTGKLPEKAKSVLREKLGLPASSSSNLTENTQ